MRPGRTIYQEDTPTTGSEGHWDSPGKVIGLGVVVPALIVSWCVIQWVLGQVAVLGRRRLHWYEQVAEPVIFWGILLFDVSIAALLFTIYVIGNHPRLGWHTEAIALVFLVAAALGLAMTLVGAAV